MSFFCFCFFSPFFFLFGFFHLFSFNEWICGLDSDCASHLLPPPALHLRIEWGCGGYSRLLPLFMDKVKAGNKVGEKRAKAVQEGWVSTSPSHASIQPRENEGSLCWVRGGRGPSLSPHPTPPNSCTHTPSLTPISSPPPVCFPHLSPTAQARIPQSFGCACALAHGPISHRSLFLLSGHP